MGKKYLKIGENKYINAKNANPVVSYKTTSTSESQNSSLNEQLTNSNSSLSNNEVKDKKSETPSINPNTSDKNKENNKSNKNEYIRFNADEVSQIQKALWQKIQTYCQSKGYPAYKQNLELTQFVNNVLQEGTAEYNLVGYGNGIIQNTDEIGKFLPKLKQLGMDSVRSMTDLDAFGYGNVKQYFMNLKERDPEKVANEIFNAYTKESDSLNLRTLEGHKDKYAYAALKVKYNNEGTYSQRGLILNFTVAGSYAPEWVSAWEQAK